MLFGKQSDRVFCLSARLKRHYTKTKERLMGVSWLEDKWGEQDRVTGLGKQRGLADPPSCWLQSLVGVPPLDVGSPRGIEPALVTRMERVPFQGQSCFWQPGNRLVWSSCLDMASSDPYPIYLLSTDCEDCSDLALHHLCAFATTVQLPSSSFHPSHPNFQIFLSINLNWISTC